MFSSLRNQLSVNFVKKTKWGEISQSDEKAIIKMSVKSIDTEREREQFYLNSIHYLSVVMES